MASWLGALPKPKHDTDGFGGFRPPPVLATADQLSHAKEPPPYGKRRNYVPRTSEDFGDGGAFPEIHVAQYPRNMGRRDAKAAGKTLALTVGTDGTVNYDDVVKQGGNKGRTVHSKFTALIPKPDAAKDASRPDEEEQEKVAKETQAALDAVLGKKLAVLQTKAVPKQPGAPELIKYTPANQSREFNSGAGQRIIKMHEAPVDPLEPPKFRVKKVPRGPGSPPVPVMHSPPRPATKAELDDWKIPPSVSNWKNPKGYIIPLDKRLAADGRGLQSTLINDKFAAFQESLAITEQKARESLQMRAQIRQELAKREKEEREARLREKAKAARMERMGVPGEAGAGAGVGEAAPGPGPGANGAAAAAAAAAAAPELPGPPSRGPPPSRGGAADAGDDYRSDRYRERPEEREERRKRDEIREERRRERERERRLEAAGEHGYKRSKLTRDRDRDVSERVALGMVHAAPQRGEAMYDQRLFNQEQGVASGLEGDDAYNIYDKPLFADRNQGLYRPKTNADDEQYGEGSGPGVDTAKFKPDKGFEGAEGGAARAKGGRVEFENEAADPFGIDSFLTDGKK